MEFPQSQLSANALLFNVLLILNQRGNIAQYSQLLLLLLLMLDPMDGIAVAVILYRIKFYVFLSVL